MISNKNKLIMSKKEQFDLMSVCLAAEDSVKKIKKSRLNIFNECKIFKTKH